MPAGGDVGRDEHADVALLEQSSARARWLWLLLPCDRGGADAGLLQMLGDAVRTALGAGEDQRAGEGFVREEFRQDLALGAAAQWITFCSHAVPPSWRPA